MQNDSTDLPVRYALAILPGINYNRFPMELNTNRKVNHQLILGSPRDKKVFSNLMQLYFYDFSEYLNFDVGENGLFPAYQDLETYWKEENANFPYLILVGKEYAGFVLVKKMTRQNESYCSVAEFFILKKYRGQGIGKSVAIEIFNLHAGPWEVSQRISNRPAHLFWNRVITGYTLGTFEEHKEVDKIIQRFPVRQ